MAGHALWFGADAGRSTLVDPVVPMGVGGGGGGHFGRGLCHERLHHHVVAAGNTKKKKITPILW